MAFKKGQSGNPKGGPKGGNPGCGRPADWFKKKCLAIVEKDNLLGFLGKVARGENVEQVVTDQGETLPVPASVKDRMRAIEMLLDRGLGRCVTPIEHSGSVSLEQLLCGGESTE